MIPKKIQICVCGHPKYVHRRDLKSKGKIYTQCRHDECLCCRYRDDGIGREPLMTEKFVGVNSKPQKKVLGPTYEHELKPKIEQSVLRNRLFEKHQKIIRRLKNE